jgi:glyoxylase-like metal-dependent hydrolase (beta-lactamase superfamily II)
MHLRSAALAAALLVLFGTALADPAQPPISDPMLPENAARQLSAHVYVIMGFPNIGIVVGRRATLVIDTGLGPRNGAVVARTAAALAAPAAGRKLYLTTTHFHPEHASGQRGFPPGTIVIRPRVQESELEADGQRFLTLFARSPRMHALLEGVGVDPANVLFDRDYTLDLGGVHARLLYFGAAHTRGDEVIFVPEDSVLISGDVVQNRLSPNIICETCSPRQWIVVLDQIAPLAPRHILPDHGALGGPELIGEERAFLVDLQGRAEALKARGVPAAEAGRQIAADFKTRYAGWYGLNNVPQSVARAYADHP